MILLLGFPKSGTSSFQTLFSNAGYNSCHWTFKNKYIGMLIKKNKQNNKPLLTGFEKINVITQMDVCINKNNAYWPQLIDYKQLYYENTNAIFILNKRNPEELLISFKKWNNLIERLHKYNPKLINDKTDKGFIDFVNKHYNDVETFFADKPNAKFITYDINNDDLTKLKKIYLKGQTIFPKSNVNQNIK
jgi:hypothetical protein